MTQRQAMLCALAAFFSWVLVDTSIKVAGQNALSPFMIMAGMGGAAVLAMLAPITVRRDFSALRTSSWRAQILICGFTILSWYANVIALKHLPLTIFYISVFTMPMVTAMLSAALKHEVLTPVKMACIIAGFLGVVIAIAPRIGTVEGEWVGYVAAACSVAGFAGYTLVIRKIAQTDSPTSLLFYTSLSLALFGMIGIAIQRQAVPDSTAMAMMLGAGLINLLANILFNKALKHTTSSNVAQLHYTQLISGALLGYLIWHEIPTINLVIGSAIIVISGLIVAAHAQQTQKVQP